MVRPRLSIGKTCIVQKHDGRGITFRSLTEGLGPPTVGAFAAVDRNIGAAVLGFPLSDEVQVEAKMQATCVTDCGANKCG